MKITRVTITGADDKIQPEQLIDLSYKYSFVEWAILVGSNEGVSRFPTRKWLAHFLGIRRLVSWPMFAALHACGAVSRDLMSGGATPFYKEFSDMGIGRFQLNFNFKTTPNYDLEKAIESIGEHQAIFQWNKSNQEIMFQIVDKYKQPNIHFLYDSSGGRGSKIVMLNMLPPVPGHYTGYAGGLSSENVEDVIKQLVMLPPFEEEIWIDVESGVRTNDELDLVKVENFLQICSPYINKVYEVV
jgi:hypothetical protein